MNLSLLSWPHVSIRAHKAELRWISASCESPVAQLQTNFISPLLLLGLTSYQQMKTLSNHFHQHYWLMQGYILTLSLGEKESPTCTTRSNAEWLLHSRHHIIPPQTHPCVKIWIFIISFPIEFLPIGIRVFPATS